METGQGSGRGRRSVLHVGGIGRGHQDDDFCSSGDPVCADGVNAVTHVSYAVNGDAEKGAKFAAEHVLAYKF
ncbi:hypothetical protein AB0M32_11080 [Streptomyces sp. NPDC051985]|uniref:hypothetical protein n=1 Tax=Streptomyces sp. NPDC051985 TaxID=3155807 RepID=UPI003426E1AE